MTEVVIARRAAYAVEVESAKVTIDAHAVAAKTSRSATARTRALQMSPWHTNHPRQRRSIFGDVILDKPIRD